jgi:hypothetical protein
MRSKPMARILGVFGFTGGFLLISPDLRERIVAGIHITDGFLQNYSPYSYLAVGMMVFGGVSLGLLTAKSA